MTTKNNKIQIIVEGESDKVFLNKLLLNNKKIDIKNIKRISNKEKVVKSIDDSIDLCYLYIIILVDLDTQKPGTENKFDCIKELKEYFYKEYLKNDKKYNDIKVIIVDKEIECWELLGYYPINNIADCKKELNNKLNKNKSLTEFQMAQQVVKNKKILKNIIDNKKGNKSFEYFMTVLSKLLL